MAKRSSPEVNAGSMADIAFLLLIFFLVTTTIETDSGITRLLPPIEENEEDVIIKQKNIFTVLLNNKDQLLVEDELMKIEDLKTAAIEFLDNGGGGRNTNWLVLDQSSGEWVDSGKSGCDYCSGKSDPKSSDNPDKAIISLKNERETTYATYISVQNELVAAYNQLRDREFTRLYPEENMSYVEADKKYSDPRTDKSVKEKLKEKISVIKLMFPMKLSEAEPNKTS